LDHNWIITPFEEPLAWLSGISAVSSDCPAFIVLIESGNFSLISLRILIDLAEALRCLAVSVKMLVDVLLIDSFVPKKLSRLGTVIAYTE
jgi:hypothetical protein